MPVLPANSLFAGENTSQIDLVCIFSRESGRRSIVTDKNYFLAFDSYGFRPGHLWIDLT